MAPKLWWLLLLPVLCKTSEPNSLTGKLPHVSGNDKRSQVPSFLLSSSSSSSFYSTGSGDDVSSISGSVSDAVKDSKRAPVFEIRTKKPVEGQAVADSINSARPRSDAPSSDFSRIGNDMTTFERHHRSCGYCMTNQQASRCPLSDDAGRLKKWHQELHRLLSFGCPRTTGDCRAGTKCCHKSDEATQNVLQHAINMARHLYTVFLEACSKCTEEKKEHWGWSQWGQWVDCSAACDSQGTRTRTRTCIPSGKPLCKVASSSAAFDNNRCPGSDRETETCYGSPCGVHCVDGQWTDWSPWGECSVTCGGGGMQQRTRTCSNPAPNRCGLDCPGQKTDVRQCQSYAPCCDWGLWGPWSACNRTCGGIGYRHRNRTCQAKEGRSACQSEQCPGPRKDTNFCGNPLVPCEPDGQWTSWEGWCVCDCRRGTRARARSCRSPLGKTLDANRCSGGAQSSRQTEKCDIRKECPKCLRRGDCLGKADGWYPSCISCRHYASCSAGQMTMHFCTANGTEWDQVWKKCRFGHSTTCSLVAGVTSCLGLHSGDYPSILGCPYFVPCSPGSEKMDKSCGPGKEFDYHLQECVMGRSTSCKVPDTPFAY